jgi:hypothetical protein
VPSIDLMKLNSVAATTPFNATVLCMAKL